MATPLVVTDRDVVHQDVLRLSAAAQVDIQTGPAPVSLAAWRSAPLVLVDGPAVGALVEQGLPRRDGLLVVTADADEPIDWAACLALGASGVLELGAADETLIAALLDSVEPVTGSGRVVAVVGAVGGAGTSLFAAALAVAAAAGDRQVVLADCDRQAAGLDLLLGVEDRSGTRWETLSAPAGRLPVAALHRSLPAPRTASGRISVLCHDRAAPAPLPESAVDVLVRSVRRSGDLLVADLARARDTASDLLVESADAVVVVCTADLRGACAAARSVGRLGGGPATGLVVRGPSPGGLGAAEIAEVVGLPLWAAMRPERQADRWWETGGLVTARRRGPLLTAARRVWARVRDGAA